MKHGLTNYFNLSFSFEWGNSCVEGREVKCVKVIVRGEGH